MRYTIVIKGDNAIMEANEIFRRIQMVQKEPMLLCFSFSHLPEKLQRASKPFYELAFDIVENIEPGDQRKDALWNLLRAKDSAVRATLHPGK